MAVKNSSNRSKVAEACLDFGSHLLRVRLSSVTPDEIQSVVKDLFSWFESKDAFLPQNTGIALAALRFGEELLEARKTATVDEAVAAIQDLYSDLTK
jgi:hypothetical protein